MATEKKGTCVEGGRRVRKAPCDGVIGLPRVSVVTAVYNSKDSLEDTIESVLCQCFADLEYAIVDGGSDDGTIDLIRRYDDRIDYWISEPDQGIYDAFNKGVDVTRGEWLYFLGAGDRLNGEDAIERVFSREPRRSRLLYGNVVWGETGREYAGKFSRVKICRRNICQQAIFYHRSLFQELGKFDIRYPVFADYAFNIRCFGRRNVNPQYRNVVVAKYPLGGYSGQVPDPEFDRDKARLIHENLGWRTELLNRAFHAQKRFFKALRSLFRVEIFLVVLAVQCLS